MIGKNLRRLPGRAEEALRYVDRAIELDETDEDAFVTRAIASLNVHGWPEAANELPPGVNERARKDLLRAVRLGSKDAPAHFLLALLYQADGDPVNAVRYGERARELDPDDLDYALFVAQLLEPDAPAKAVPIYEQVRRGRPDDGDAATGLALALQRCGDWARARDAYRDALALDPDSADLHNNFAFALWETGDIEGSLAEWAAALAAVPELADAHAGRAIALEKQGDGDGALAAYRRATELDASYLDLDKLVAEFLWSPAARATIEPVRARLVAAGASQQV
jgi:Tfp pilus assembly protein PilF